MLSQHKWVMDLDSLILLLYKTPAASKQNGVTHMVWSPPYGTSIEVGDISTAATSAEPGHTS